MQELGEPAAVDKDRAVQRARRHRQPEQRRFVWYPTLGKKGFAKPRVLSRPHDENAGPRLLASDPQQADPFASGNKGIWQKKCGRPDVQTDIINKRVSHLKGEIANFERRIENIRSGSIEP